jgi:predicted ATPase
VRMGLHFGRAWRRDDDYFGAQVNKTARICDAGHGGQVLASQEFMDACGEPGSEVVITDLARHRLRGLGEPEHLYQLTLQDWDQQTWPTLRTLDDIPTNLPAQITSFVGRDDELQKLAELLTIEGTRLITLTGPGGSGKSRLAQQAVAREMEHFPDGVFWVDLVPVHSPEAVVAAIMQTLKVEPQANTSAVEIIAARAAGRRFLLIIDNFEHVMDAAEMLAELLQNAPDLKLLVTSREVLHIAGENIYEVMPLPLPQPPINWQTLSQCDSVHLFLHRARSVSHGFDITSENAAPVSEICSRVDGIPLAIELTAAWIRDFTPAQIVAHLGADSRVLTSRVRGVTDRQRTLEETLQWSYRLLDEDDQRVFRALSVFEGGFFLDAADGVCRTGATDSVLSLHDKSLLHTREVLGKQRYYMLETIRQFAADKLQDAGEEEDARAAFHIHFTALGAALFERMEGNEPGDSFKLCETELPNLSQCLHYAALDNRPADIEGLTKALNAVVMHRPPIARSLLPVSEQAWQWAQQHPAEPWTYCVAHTMLAQLYSAQEYQRALDIADDVLATIKTSQDDNRIWRCFRVLCACADGARDLGRARRWVAEAEQYMPAPERCVNIANIYVNLGMHDRAIECARRVLAELPEDVPARQRSQPLARLTQASLLGGDIEQAYRASVELRAVAASRLRGYPIKEFDAAFLAVAPYALTGRVAEATQFASEAARMASSFAPETAAVRYSSLLQQINYAQLWGLGVELTDELFPDWPPPELRGDRLVWAGIAMAEACARTGHADRAITEIERVLNADWDWDGEERSSGRALKSTSEVLRVTGNLTEAVTVIALASRLLDNHPFLKGTCEDLLDLITADMEAEHFAPEESAAAREAAGSLQPSAAITLAREALGLRAAN